MPAATLDSDKILKQPSCAVLLTCVPPQNSVDHPLMSTTRTISPYFTKQRHRAQLFCLFDGHFLHRDRQSFENFLIDDFFPPAEFLRRDGVEVRKVETDTPSSS